MDKRRFIKLSAAMLATRFGLAASGGKPADKLKNWAGNYQYGTDKLHPARSVEEVQKLVKKRVYSTNAWKSAMTATTQCRDFRAEARWARTALPA